MNWTLDFATQQAAQNYPLVIQARHPAEQFAGHNTFDRDRWRRCYLRELDHFLPLHASNTQADSPTQIIAEFQRDGTYLPALALTICWGAMWRQRKKIYGAGIDEIHNTLSKCAASILATESIEQSWQLLTGNNLGWTSVMASKTLHFLCRALGFELKPPVPIDGKVIRERVWTCFRQRMPAPRPDDWNGDSFDAYRRYMTAIITWADAKGWTTTQVESTIFAEYS